MIHNVLAAYYGEIYGIAFFNHYLNHYAHGEQQTLWQTLIEVEELTAEKLKPVLLANGMDIENRHQEMLDKGLADATKWIELPRLELVATLLKWVEPYETKYRAWHEEVKASQQYSIAEREAIELIADHETAIYHCWQHYHIGESGLPALNAFLAKYR
ncbi:hypothetical protein [Vibrio rotiferianus]|uniref:hypothetical protein n=1 Tax=Vibrio rotiferianus TaxID=190895 RepID=UPI00039CC32A|nr:hypothetical protein [Vibrio rotiferianus]PIB13469.1 hypothetical protein B853_19029 [Vibrio rotiferianus CAIM 577 = LMG 21460]